MVVADRDRHAPAVLLRLGERAGGDLLRLVDGDRIAVRRPLLRRSKSGGQREHNTQHDSCGSHDSSPLVVVGKATIPLVRSSRICCGEQPSSASNSGPCSPISGGSERLGRRFPPRSSGSAGTRIVLPEIRVSSSPPEAFRCRSSSRSQGFTIGANGKPIASSFAASSFFECFL